MIVGTHYLTYDTRRQDKFLQIFSIPKPAMLLVWFQPTKYVMHLKNFATVIMWRSYRKRITDVRSQVTPKRHKQNLRGREQSDSLTNMMLILCSATVVNYRKRKIMKRQERQFFAVESSMAILTLCYFGMKLYQYPTVLTKTSQQWCVPIFKNTTVLHLLQQLTIVSTCHWLWSTYYTQQLHFDS